MVGYCGAGAWATSGTLSIAKTQLAGAGLQNAALVAGGFTNASTNATELFNGATWATSGVLNSVKRLHAAFGSQNAAVLTGGFTSANSNATELFNGSLWSTSGVLSAAKREFSGSGSQNAGLVAGGFVAANTNVTELFNGATWTTSGTLSIAKGSVAIAGSQNAALIAGGLTAASTNVTELFNGSSWSLGGVLSVAKREPINVGSQNAALVAGGFTTAYTNASELFNGSSWSTSGTLSSIRGSTSGAGGQAAGLIAAGTTGAALRTTELHSQTTFRKILGKNIPDAKNIGILSSASTVLIQGTNASVTYPANKYLILNRSLNAAVTNYSNVSSLTFASIIGTAPSMTYNLSATANLLAVVPGMIAIVTGNGSNTASAVNTGSFIISRVVNPSSLEIQNASGVAENPSTGTISVISTMLAVDYISPKDIVVGKTDSAGLLTVQGPLIIGNLLRRLK